MIVVSVINKSENELPHYQTTHSAGLDLSAFLAEPIELLPGERKLIGTGLSIALPEGYEAQVRSRSGLAMQHGIAVLNSPGTIDADYRGEIKVLLINHGADTFVVNNGDRIAQMVVQKHEKIEWQLTDSLSETTRGAGGYGSTGK